MKTLVDEEYLQLITKIFVEMPSANEKELDKNIVALNNEEYGQLMKVKYLREKDNISRIDLIKQQVKTVPNSSSSANAPR